MFTYLPLTDFLTTFFIFVFIYKKIVYLAESVGKCPPAPEMRKSIVCGITCQHLPFLLISSDSCLLRTVVENHGLRVKKRSIGLLWKKSR